MAQNRGFIMKSNKIYEKKEYIIIKSGTGYIVYNTNKKFEQGHTHLKSYNAAKTAIDLAIKNKIPRSYSMYFLESLIRISDNLEYMENIDKLIEVRNNRGSKEKYVNCQKIVK